MEIDGLKKLEKKLSNMEKKTAKTIVRKAVRKAQDSCLSVAKQNAQTMVGGEMGTAIASALKVKALYKQKKGGYQLQVAIDPAKAQQFKHTTKAGTIYYIPTAIEYGHKTAGGVARSIPYMRKAGIDTEQKRIDILIKEIDKGLDTI